MTEKQMQYIITLEDFILDFAHYGKPKKLSKDILGDGWYERYKEISHKEASECINYLQEQAHTLGCYEDDWAITNGYD